MVGILLLISRWISAIIGIILWLIGLVVFIFGIPLLLAGIIPGIITIIAGVSIMCFGGMFFKLATLSTHDEMIEQEAQAKIDQAEHDREVQAVIDSR